MATVQDEQTQSFSQPMLRQSRLRRWAGPIVLLLAGAALATWLVPYFPDVMVDFGREVYVPWRITQGEAIYRDIEYFNGPLSPYLHALVMSIFGVSIATLKFFNLLLLGLVTALLYRLLVAMTDRFAATVASLVFLALFAFGHLTAFANFNWITPYSYELPHGIALSLAMIVCLWRYGLNQRRSALAAAGLLLGLVFLTKAEVFFAAALTGGAGAIMGIRISAQRPRERLAHASLFLAAALAPVLLAAALLATIMPLATVLDGLAGSWKWIGDRELASLQYFKITMGTLDTRQSLIDIAMWTLFHAALAALMVAVAFVARRIVARPWQRGLVGLLGGAAVVGAMLLLSRDPQFWIEHTRPVPLFMTIAGVVLLRQVWKHRRDPQQLAKVALPMMMVIFAGALLGKILLNVRPVHYGFALAMPASVLTIAWLVGALPRRLERSGAAPQPARLMATAAMAVIVVILLIAEARMVSMKTGRIGSGGDAFYSDPVRARFMAAAMQDILALPTPNQTLVVMPEGLMLGYLTRRVNPSGHLNFTPPAVIMFGEQRMLMDLYHSAPDLITLIHTDTSIYDAPFFGRDYAREIALWIRRNYHPVSQIGPLPFTSERFGILILRRNDLAGAMPAAQVE